MEVGEDGNEHVRRRTTPFGRQVLGRFHTRGRRRGWSPRLVPRVWRPRTSQVWSRCPAGSIPEAVVDGARLPRQVGAADLYGVIATLEDLARRDRELHVLRVVVADGLNLLLT